MSTTIKRFLWIFCFFGCLFFGTKGVHAETFCYSGTELGDNIERLYYAPDDWYHHTSQGLCVAGHYVIETRYQAESVPTTYVVLDLNTMKEVGHYDMKTEHSNSLTYNPDKHELVCSNNSKVFLMDFDESSGKITYKKSIGINHNCPKIAYDKENKVYYLGTSTTIWKTKDFSSLSYVFGYSQKGINQGMGFDGKHLYVIWYRVGKCDVDVFGLDGKKVKTYTLYSPILREIEDIDFYEGNMIMGIANSPDNNGIFEVKSKHEYGKWKTTKKPTCVDGGSKERVCKSCGDTETQEIPPTEKHTPPEWKTTKKPTCGQSGKRKMVCTVCHKTLKKEEIPATGQHKPSDWQITQQPTCETEGHQQKVCGVCHQIVQEETIPALGHDWSDWKQTREQTVFQSGKEERTCNRCGKTESEDLGKLSPTLTLKEENLKLGWGETKHPLKCKMQRGDYLWSIKSSDSRIVSLNKDGSLKAKRFGNAVLTYKTKAGGTAKVKVKVSVIPKF